ncbi:hypothetical protein HRE53_27345 (plasmid) [Acaryochloris sp. 'Moss Beach']|uniref:hypothetical protein n=1 Tax=Acaryochloris sp. 'Moss Beach' TaxID=2740837 RepID=UPI001F3D307A|nr:hypothetical protein [Acaryochloris sp. 'Moss Beach']UJB72313.1 hypothetical protein HRE53_27345 [Acaryochloris sp. 'Moss Beach']
MDGSESHISEDMVVKVLAEASRLQAETDKTYLLEDLRKVCAESQILPENLEKALVNVDEEQYRARKEKMLRQDLIQKRRQEFKNQGIKSISIGMKLLIPAIAVSSLFLFRSKLEPLIDDWIFRLNSQHQTQLETEIKTLQGKLFTLTETQKDLKAQLKTTESKLEATRKAELPPIQQRVTGIVESVRRPIAKQRPEVINRKDFRNRVMGKTEQEVLQAVGRPSSTSDLSTLVFWRYVGIVKDEISGNIGGAKVQFKNGVVTKVSFR